MTIQLHKDKLSIDGNTWLEAGEYTVLRALGFRRYMVRVNKETDRIRVLTIINLNTDDGDITWQDQ